MDNDMYHHGVKGMKWGRRRTSEQLEASRNRIKKVTKGVAIATGVAATIAGGYYLNKKFGISTKATAAAKTAAESYKNRNTKENILKSPSKLAKNLDKFTQAEIGSAMKRFETQSKLNTYSSNKFKAPKQKIDAILGYVAVPAAMIGLAVNTSNQVKQAKNFKKKK